MGTIFLKKSKVSVLLLLKHDDAFKMAALLTFPSALF